MTATDTPSFLTKPPIANKSNERKGRKWLFVSFIFCPCHLPVIMAVLGLAFGGTAFGALVGRNTIGVGLVFGLIYAVLLVVGFGHLRAATKDMDCTDGECKLPA
jgi:hypothetical protein